MKTFLLLMLITLSSCASGPICTGTEEEVRACQERMARARENRMNREFGGGRRFY